MLYWIGFVIWFLGLIGYSVFSTLSKKWNTLLYFTSTVGFLTAVMGADSNGENRILKSLTEGVNPKEVAVQGQNIFRVQAEILYNDGELKSVTLIPDTTTPLGQ